MAQLSRFADAHPSFTPAPRKSWWHRLASDITNTYRAVEPEAPASISGLFSAMSNATTVVPRIWETAGAPVESPMRERRRK